MLSDHLVGLPVFRRQAIDPVFIPESFLPGSCILIYFHIEVVEFSSHHFRVEHDIFDVTPAAGNGFVFSDLQKFKVTSVFN